MDLDFVEDLEKQLLTWLLELFRSATYRVIVLSSFVLLHSLGVAAADEASCERYAASTDELGAEGVKFEELDIDKSLPACKRAVAENPKDFVSAFRLARVLLAAERAEEAIPFVKMAVEAGYIHAHNLIGYMYLNGLGVEKDEAKGFAAIEQGHSLGDPRATYNLGWFYDTGTYVERSDSRAAELYRQAAEAGFADAAYFLSDMLWRGVGLSVNTDEALRFLRQAADGGHVNAQDELARRLISGDGIELDVGAGYDLAVTASRNGSGYAAYLMGFVHEQGIGRPSDLDSAMWFYKVSTKRNHPNGQVALGRLLTEVRGVEYDPARARELFSLAAESGSIEAKARLGQMLVAGEGGPKNVMRGLKWLQEASNHPVAQYALGLRVLESADTMQKRRAGLALLKQAANSGHVDAQVEAAKILGNKDARSLRDNKAAVKYLALAASKEHPEALFLYGVRLIEGNGVRTDVARGFEMLEQAAALGDPLAAPMIDIQRKIIKNKVELAKKTQALCEETIRQFNRGAYVTDDGKRIFNTRNGKHWFEPSGRMVPRDQAPDFGCPQ